MKLSSLLTLVAVIVNAALGIIFGKYVFLTRWFSNALDHHGPLNRIGKAPDMDLTICLVLLIYVQKGLHSFTDSQDELKFKPDIKVCDSCLPNG